MFSSNATQVSSANYIEDVFSTYLYTGNATARTITNDIDLLGKGGLVWIKARSQAYNNYLSDSATGPGLYLISNGTNALSSISAVTDFTSSGFELSSGALYNGSGTTFTSWSFRKQPKFFDIVTYTGTGSNTTISHSLGSVPACIMVKRTDTTGDWQVYHSSLANTEYLVLNTTAAKATGATRWNSTTPTSTVFSIGTDATVNASGGTYVAYLFAHDAGGFGLSGSDNVISCGSFTSTSGGAASVTLGYEPQWLLIKRSSGADNWYLIDNMRGYSYSQTASLAPNSSAAEDPAAFIANPTATGFEFGTGTLFNSSTYIYIAIRRGPMKVPTSGTSVFSPVTYTGNNTNNRLITSNFPVDMSLSIRRDAMGESGFFSRLTGDSYILYPSSTAAIDYQTDKLKFGSNSGVLVSYVSAGGISTNQSSDPLEQMMFKRAPSFFDEVCYTGTGSATTQTHNLGVVPEMMIIKARVPASGTFDWFVYTAAQGNGYFTRLNSSDAKTTGTQWNSTTPTSSVFSIGATSDVNQSGGTYVAYLFATCAGVSKVGSYTGTGTTKQIDCGFTGGARFVLIKRTDSTGDWYVWDTARGIVSGNDPYLLLNSTAAEVTNTDYIDTYSAGFEISSTAPAAINASGGTFIFLAIA